MTAKISTGPDQQLSDWLRGYQPPAGVADELLDGRGQMRPPWRRLIAELARLKPAQLQARLQRGDRYLHDSGVFYRQHDHHISAERDWPFSHMPVLIDDDEWNTISAGLIERAELLERMLSDFYGANTLVQAGLLPGALLAGNPEWLRPLVGTAPRSGHHLHFIAFDIGRGPLGRWWVLGDRTQAPSGAGFALENRIASKRIYSEIYDQSRVRRLSGFFREFRGALEALKSDPDSLIGLLTPGPLNETYFEQAFIARYLGFLLLEGEDLCVRQGQLMVRTVAGLKPIEVLWRRLDASWADPLELNESSRLGTAGLLGSLRAGGIEMVNALGSGVLEARALLAFIPRIAEHWNGKPLALPNIATWWCGQPVERAWVKQHAAQMIIGKAWSTRLPFEIDAQAAVAGHWVEPSTLDLGEWIDRNGAELVGQQAVTLSTTPALIDGRLTPRPMSLRVFLARTSEGWQVMPGGFARIGHSADATTVGMQRGGSAADVWIVSRKPLSDRRAPPLSRSDHSKLLQSVALPTRAADNLYWLGRYTERFEGLVRFNRAYHLRLFESGLDAHPLLPMMAEFVAKSGVDLGEAIPAAAVDALDSATACAAQVRDRLSIDAWLALKDLGKTMTQFQLKAQAGEDAARAMGVLLRKIYGLSGLIHENMYRYTGWRFLSIGRALERAMATADLLAALAATDAGDGELDLLLEVADSSMVHRRRYAASVSRDSVIELLALDELNPRSIRYQIEQISEHLQQLPKLPGTRSATPQKQFADLRRAFKPHTALSLDAGKLRSLWLELGRSSGVLTSTYLR